MDLATGVVPPTFAVPPDRLVPYERARMRAHEGGYYIRLSVRDRVGAFASIATRMAENGISLESIVQRKSAGAADVASAMVVLVTHDSFYLPEELVADFERESGYDLEQRAGGDAGALLRTHRRGAARDRRGGTDPHAGLHRRPYP